MIREQFSTGNALPQHFRDGARLSEVSRVHPGRPALDPESLSDRLALRDDRGSCAGTSDTLFNHWSAWGDFVSASFPPCKSVLYCGGNIDVVSPFLVFSKGLKSLCIADPKSPPASCIEAAARIASRGGISDSAPGMRHAARERMGRFRADGFIVAAESPPPDVMPFVLAEQLAELSAQLGGASFSAAGATITVSHSAGTSVIRWEDCLVEDIRPGRTFDAGYVKAGLELTLYREVWQAFHRALGPGRPLVADTFYYNAGVPEHGDALRSGVERVADALFPVRDIPRPGGAVSHTLEDLVVEKASAPGAAPGIRPHEIMYGRTFTLHVNASRPVDDSGIQYERNLDFWR